MEHLEEAKIIISIVGTLATLFFVVLIPTAIKAWKAWKAYKEAQTEAEKQAAINDLTSLAKDLIISAENAYKEVDAILKQQGNKGSGAVKKDSVMTKLQAACIEKGIDFDCEYWSNKVDELVKLTREVNAAKGA